MLRSFFKFHYILIQRKKYWKYNVRLLFWRNTCDREVFRSTILQPFQFEPEQKRTFGKRATRKNLRKQTFAFRPATLLNRDSNTGVFLWSLRNFSQHFFSRTPPLATSETKHIHASAVDLLHIRIGYLDWCKCRHCKNEARNIRLSLL